MVFAYNHKLYNFIAKSSIFKRICLVELSCFHSFELTGFEPRRTHPAAAVSLLPAGALGTLAPETLRKVRKGKSCPMGLTKDLKISCKKSTFNGPQSLSWLVAVVMDWLLNVIETFSESF